MPETLSFEARELLVWISSSPRTYKETIEVWRTNCPHHAVWEDALAAGFVHVRDGTNVTLTPAGRQVLIGGSGEI